MATKPRRTTIDLKCVVRELAASRLAVGLNSLSQNDIEGMSKDLNDYALFFYSMGRGLPPPRRDIDKLHRITTAADELKSAFVNYYGSYPFLDAWDSLNGHPKKPASIEHLNAMYGTSPPDKGVEFLHRAGTSVPSCDAFRAVGAALEGISLIKQLADWELERAKKRQAGSGALSSEEQRRRLAITWIASIYHKYTHEPPMATRDGEWCAFLAATLTKFGGRELSIEAAYKAWLATTKWLRNMEIDYPWLPSDKGKRQRTNKTRVGPDIQR